MTAGSPRFHSVGLAAGRVVNRFGMANYFRLHLGDHSLRWVGLLFHDEEGGTRTTPVAPIEPSESAKTKKRSPRLDPDLPLQTYRGLIQSLTALSRSTVRLGSSTYTRCAKPTPLQAEAFKRLGLALP